MTTSGNNLPENPLAKYLDRRWTFSIRLRSLFFLLISFFSLAYLAWEIYWYRHVGLAFVHGHTHILPWLFLFLLLALYKPRKRRRVYTVLVSLSFFLFFLEVLLQVSGQLKTYSEKTTGIYRSPFIQSGSASDYYHLWPADKKTHTPEREEFTFTFPTNSLGFPDEEWQLPSPGDSAMRIMTLGDSFTEGDGAPYDSSYVMQLRRLLHQDSSGIYLMNAGVCGSDPFFNYINLRDRLLPYKPDIVLQTICSHDLYYDIAQRGGMERFGDNYTLRYKNRPWWEPIYAISYISRIFFRLVGYNNELVRSGGQHDLQAASTAYLHALLDVYLPLCRENTIHLVLIIRPDKEEIVENRYGYDFSEIKNWLAAEKDVTVIDLLPLYQQELQRTNTTMQDYFWKKDSHHNSRGYRLMARCIYRELLPLLK